MIRHCFVWVHRWTGLLMAGFLVIVGLTGSLLAYRIQIDRLINPQLFAKPPKSGVQRLDLATLAERAEAAAPQARVAYFNDDVPDQVSIRCAPRVNPATGKPYQLDFDHIILNPWTGEELGRRSEYDIQHVRRINLMAFLYDLHTSLAQGNGGVLVLGIVALIWTLDCFVGFYLTLPLGLANFLKRWKLAWWVKWRAKAFRIHFDLHRAGGLWGWPVLFIFAWSSVMFNLRPVYEKVTHSVFDYRSGLDVFTSLPAHPIENPNLDWHAAQARGEQLMAEQAAIQGFKVTRPSGLAYIDILGVYAYTVQSSRDFRRRSPGTYLFLDGSTGELRYFSLPNGEHTGNTISNWLWALHYGDVYGLRSYRFLVCLIGLLIVLLSVTGVYIWLKKRNWRKLSDANRRIIEKETLNAPPHAGLAGRQPQPLMPKQSAGLKESQ
jgi:uncharacterized iron-regulated membrane protein